MDRSVLVPFERIFRAQNEPREMLAREKKWVGADRGAGAVGGTFRSNLFSSRIQSFRFLSSPNLPAPRLRRRQAFAGGARGGDENLGPTFSIARLRFSRRRRKRKKEKEGEEVESDVKSWSRFFCTPWGWTYVRFFHVRGVVDSRNSGLTLANVPIVPDPVAQQG